MRLFSRIDSGLRFALSKTYRRRYPATAIFQPSYPLGRCAPPPRPLRGGGVSGATPPLPYRTAGRGRAAAPTTPWLPCAKGAVMRSMTEGLSVLFPLFRRGGVVNGHMQSNKPIVPIRILRFPAKHIFSYVVHPPYAALYFSFRAYICGRRTKIMVRRRILNPTIWYPYIIQACTMIYAICKKYISAFDSVIRNGNINIICSN